jgi:hypothetical protein
MATSTVNPNEAVNTGASNEAVANTSVATTNGTGTANVGYDIETYVVVKETTTDKDEKGNEVTNVSFKSYPQDTFQDDSGKAKKPGEVVFSQSMKFPKALTLAGILELCPDEGESKGEAVNMFNRGLKVKLQNRGRAILTETDKDGNLAFEPQEGSLDLTEEAASPTQKRGLSPLDKIMKVLTGATPEQRAAIMAALSAS